MDALLRAQDVAKILNLRVSTVYELCHRGSIPHVRLSEGMRRALIRFRGEDIEQLVQDGTVSTRTRTR